MFVSALRTRYPLPVLTISYRSADESRAGRQCSRRQFAKRFVCSSCCAIRSNPARSNPCRWHYCSSFRGTSPRAKSSRQARAFVRTDTTRNSIHRKVRKYFIYRDWHARPRYSCCYRIQQLFFTRHSREPASIRQARCGIIARRNVKISRSHLFAIVRNDLPRNQLNYVRANHRIINQDTYIALTIRS